MFGLRLCLVRVVWEDPAASASVKRYGDPVTWGSSYKEIQRHVDPVRFSDTGI